MSHTTDAAIGTVNRLMEYILVGNFEEAKEMIIGDVEAVDLPQNGENERLIYSILGAEEEGEGVVVPVEMEVNSPEIPRKQKISFVCVQTPEGQKVDMDLTLKSMMGATPADLLEAMQEDLTGVVRSVEQEVERARDEELDPELYSPECLTQAFREGLGRIEDRFDDELADVAERLGNVDLEWEVAWGTMCDDGGCPARLLGAVISPLRSALAMLEDHRSEDPVAGKNDSIRKVRENIQVIRILNANDHRLCECSLAAGRLTLIPCLMPQHDQPLAPTAGFSADEIEWSIRDALDLDVGPAIRRSEVGVAGFVDDCTSSVGFTPKVTVDWESFRAIAKSRDALDALKRLRNDLLPSVHHALFHLKKKVPLADCLEELQFRNVEKGEDEYIRVEGKMISFGIPLAESRCLTTGEIQSRLADLVRELPLPQAEAEVVAEAGSVEEDEIEPEEGAGSAHYSLGVDEHSRSDFQQMVTSMEAEMMGVMRDQMSLLYGKDFGLDVDWASMDEDQDHFNLVVSGVLGAVMGALMVMAYDPVLKERMVNTVRGMSLRYDNTLRGVALSLDQKGKLGVACGGPASQYIQDSAAMVELIKGLVP